MTFVCKEICKNHKKKLRGVGHRFYVGNRKRCGICEIFIDWEGIWCPCCGCKLRTRPEKKANRIRYYKEKLLNSILPKTEVLQTVTHT